MKTTLTALAALGLAVAAVPATAGETTIRYDDLNLNTDAGQKVLAMRISKAARAVCGDTAQTGSRIPSAKAKECVQKAEAQAHAQMAARVEADAKGG